jgi:hypothetical protein
VCIPFFFFFFLVCHHTLTGVAVFFLSSRLIPLFFSFSFLSFLAVIYWSDDEEGERLFGWLSRGAGVKC